MSAGIYILVYSYRDGLMQFYHILKYGHSLFHVNLDALDTCLKQLTLFFSVKDVDIWQYWWGSEAIAISQWP